MPTSPIVLSPGQYQIGDVVFGRNTIYPVTNVEINSYNTNAQDYQVIRADENRFGQDNFQPQPIIFTMGVEDNFVLENMRSLTGLSAAKEQSIENVAEYALADLAREWRGDDVRTQWNAMKPIRCCERDGKVLLWYGRPRKFQYSKRSLKSQFFQITAEFMRADTLQYTDDEYLSVFANGENKTISRTHGDAPAWYRILLYGPANHPIIQIGDIEINFDYNIPADVIVEISSYPWSRRVVSSTNLNLASKLIGASQYLDQLRFPAFASREVTWDATSTNGDSAMVFLWRNAYSVMA